MKRLGLLLTLCICLISNSFAAMTIGTFKDFVKSYNRCEDPQVTCNGNAEDSLQAGLLLGYVSGASEAVSATLNALRFVNKQAPVCSKLTNGALISKTWAQIELGTYANDTDVVFPLLQVFDSTLSEKNCK